MAKYIEREAAKKLIDNACAECREACEEFDGFYADCNQCLLHGVKNKLPHLPAADVRPVVRGKWKREYLASSGGGTYAVCRCSECKWQYPLIETHFCPNCGADMREGET